MVWKARSQAANQGYSHLSGIEMTCSLSMCGQSLFRIAGAARPSADRRHVPGAIFPDNRRNSTACSHSIPRQGLAHSRFAASALTPGGRQAAVRNASGLALAHCQAIGEAVEGIADRFGRRVGQSQADEPRFARHPPSPGSARRPWSRSCCGLTASCRPAVTKSLIAVLDVGGRIGRVEEALIVRSSFLGEKQRWAVFTMEVIGPELGIGGSDDAVAVRGGSDFQGRPGRFPAHQLQILRNHNEGRR